MEKTYPNIFYIPEIQSENLVTSTIIGVIDSSGSMSSCWKYAAMSWNKVLQHNKDVISICFTTQSKCYEGNLSEKIQDHGGKTTNIESGFAMLNQKLKLEKTQKNITIVFISDGGDDKTSTLETRLEKIRIDIDPSKKINFISIGVGTGFPTFIAMKLRDMYHNGESNIPPVFLIEKTCDIQEWENTFTILDPYLKHNAKLTVEPQIKLFPWTPYQNEAYSKSFVVGESPQILVKGAIQADSIKDIGMFNKVKNFVFGESPQIIVKDGVIVDCIKDFDVFKLIKIAKAWIGELQLTSLKTQVQEQAKLSYSILNNLWIEVQNNKKDAKKKTQKTTFNDRMQKKFSNLPDVEFQSLLKEIRNYGEENILNKLSESEAAKRLAIGTQTGKYHDKALKMRGVTVEDYEKDRDRFIQLLQETKLNNETSQEPSSISLQTQKEIFQETDLIDGLKLCPSQYDLVEALPVVGHAIRVRRTDGSMINPYFVQVIDMAKHHKIVDTISIQSGENNQLELAAGENDKEIVNAVIPLFEESDIDMKPLLNSRLYSLLMTFNLMSNADTCYSDAYLALLSNSFLYLISQSVSDWRQNLLNLLYSTLKITYVGIKNFDHYVETLIKTPRIAIVTDHPDITTKCEDLSKALFVLYYLVREQRVTEEQCQEIILNVLGEVVGRWLPGDTSFLSQFFKISDENIEKKIDFSPYTNKILADFPDLMTFYTIQDIKNEINTQISKAELKLNVEFDVNLDYTKLWFLNDGQKFSKKVLADIWKFFLPKSELYDEKYYFYWLYHANKYRNNFERNKTQLSVDYNEIYGKIKKEFEQSLLNSNPIFTDCFSKLLSQYCEKMKSIHNPTFTMTVDQIKEELAKKGIEYDETKFVLQDTSNLLINACNAQNCPFYLQYNPQFSNHMAFNDCKIPAFHKTIKLNCDKSPNDIYQMIRNGDCLDKTVPNYQVNKDQIDSEVAQNYLEQTKELILEEIKENSRRYQELVKK